MYVVSLIFATVSGQPIWELFQGSRLLGGVGKFLYSIPTVVRETIQALHGTFPVRLDVELFCPESFVPETVQVIPAWYLEDAEVELPHAGNEWLGQG